MTTSWPLAKLGDHVDLLAGFAFKSRGFSEDADDVRLLRGANIGQGSLKWEKAKRWPNSKFADHRKFELAVDDIVLAMDRPWIEAGLKWSVLREPDLPALLVQRVARLRATGPLSQDFLRFLVGSPQFEAYVRPIVTGVNVPHISPSQIRDFSFLLPPRQIQDAIARLLRPVDDLIENNRRRIEVMEEMARLLYREWFVHFRFPGHEDVEFVDSDLGPIPEGWRSQTLESCLASLVDGDWIETKDQGGDSYRLLQVSNIGLGRFRETGKFRYITEETFAFLKCTSIIEGDVLVSRMPDPVGRAWCVDHLKKPSITAVDVAILRPEHNVDGPFLELYLNSGPTLAHAKQVSTGTTRKRVARSVLSQFKLAWPPHSLRDGFYQIVGPAYELKSVLTRQNDALAETRELLLPRLVSGELDVSELDLDLEAVGV